MIVRYYPNFTAATATLLSPDILNRQKEREIGAGKQCTCINPPVHYPHPAPLIATSPTHISGSSIGGGHIREKNILFLHNLDFELSGYEY
jgi:hypothetical protein